MMQVADEIAAPLARANLSLRAASVRVSATISIEQKQASAPAMWAMKYIADSTRLSGSEKKTLIRLVAMVDEFAGGDAKLMNKIIAIAKFMEADTPEGTYRHHTMKQVMEEYWKQREALNPEAAFRISVETEITLVEMEVTATAKTAQIGAENPSIS